MALRPLVDAFFLLALVVWASSNPVTETPTPAEATEAVSEVYAELDHATEKPMMEQTETPSTAQQTSDEEKANMTLKERCEAKASRWSPWSTKGENIKTGCGNRRRTRAIHDQELAKNCSIPLAEHKEDCGELTKKEKLTCLQYYFVNDVFGKSGVLSRRKRMFDPSLFRLQPSEPEAGCPDDITRRKVDFLVMIDKSGGMERKLFRQLLRSVVFLVNKAIPVISQDTTRMALITFANVPEVEFKLDRCDNKTCVEELTYQSTFQQGGLTRMATALQEAEHVFDTRHGMRECSRRVILLFTDGAGGRYETVAPQVPARNLKVGKGVEIFAIGITELISEAELLDIVSTPSLTHLYYMETIKQTRRIFRRLKTARDNDSVVRDEKKTPSKRKP